MTNGVQPHLVFPHTYECQVLSETNAAKIYYPGASTVGGRDGVIVRVIPRDAPAWVGVFAFADISDKGTSGVFSTPNADRLCVVAKGSAYFVSATDPNRWERIPAIPVIDVRCVAKHGIIVFANNTELMAYDSTGPRWRTDRLTWDSMKVVATTEDLLTGEYWDIRTESIQTFTVDLSTGNSRGGLGNI